MHLDGVSISRVLGWRDVLPKDTPQKCAFVDATLISPSPTWIYPRIDGCSSMFSFAFSLGTTPGSGARVLRHFEFALLRYLIRYDSTVIVSPNPHHLTTGNQKSSLTPHQEDRASLESLPIIRSTKPYCSDPHC